MTAQALQPPQPRPDWMKEHLSTLFAAARAHNENLRFELRAIHPTRKGPGGKFITNNASFPLNSKGLSEGIAWAANLNQNEGFNLYVGANPRKPVLSSSTGAKEDDIEPFFEWLFVDADSDTAVTALRQNTGPQHGMIVATGLAPSMRCHCYWQVEEAIQNPAAWSDLQKHLQRAFGTDAVFDTPRILRLAGSVSYPSEKKAAKGYRVEIVQITVYEDRDPVTPEAILAIPAPEAPASPTTSGPLDLANGGDPMALVGAIQRGEDLHNNSRDLVWLMVSEHRADWEIMTLVGELLRGRSDGGTMAEVPGLIQSARQKSGITSAGAMAVQPPPESAGPLAIKCFLTDPPPREWVVTDWVVQGAVNSLYGHGGVGKTLLAQQIGLCVATGMPFLDMPTKQMPVLAVLCEDDQDEVHRRSHAMLNVLTLGFNPHLDDCLLWSRIGAQNFLLDYQNGRPLVTPFYQQVFDHLKDMGPEPKLLILDTLADLFGGNEIDRVQANYFVKTTLGNIALATNTTILMLAHPSRSGLDSGDMLSGSTAWHNAVRSRLALQWVKGDDGKPDPDMIDQRILTRPKANYAQANAEVLIEYKGGAFFAVPTTKSQVEEQGIDQTVRDAIAHQAARGTPLSYHDRAQRSARKYKFMRHGKRIAPADAMKSVDRLIDRKVIQVVEGQRNKNGLYPMETT